MEALIALACVMAMAGMFFLPFVALIAFVFLTEKR